MGRELHLIFKKTRTDLTKGSDRSFQLEDKSHQRGGNSPDTPLKYLDLGRNYLMNVSFVSTENAEYSV